MRDITDAVLEIHSKVIAIETKMESLATREDIYEKITEHRKDCNSQPSRMLRNGRPNKVVIALITAVGGVIGSIGTVLVAYFS